MMMNSALSFWAEEPISDPFDPNTWDLGPATCHIYDPDLIRFAIVDQKYYSQLMTQWSEYRSKLVARHWHVNSPHPSRNGKKQYFVSSAGWRQGKHAFLHVEVMKLSRREPPSPRHKLVNHKDGNEWNCTEDNLEWATAVTNRRKSRQKYNRPSNP